MEDKRLIILGAFFAVYVMYMLIDKYRAYRHKVFRKNYETLRKDVEEIKKGTIILSEEELISMELWIDTLSIELDRMSTFPYPNIYRAGLKRMEEDMKCINENK